MDGGLSKNCPGCRGPQGLAETVRLHGLDDLVKGLQSILGEEQWTDHFQTGFSKSHYLNKRFP